VVLAVADIKVPVMQAPLVPLVLWVVVEVAVDTFGQQIQPSSLVAMVWAAVVVVAVL
jgi:hypothetical protein